MSKGSMSVAQAPQQSSRDKIVIDRLLNYVFQGKSQEEKEDILKNIMEEPAKPEESRWVTQSADVQNFEELLSKPSVAKPKEDEEAILQDSLYAPELSEKIEDSPKILGAKAAGRETAIEEQKPANAK